MSNPVNVTVDDGDTTIVYGGTLRFPWSHFKTQGTKVHSDTLSEITGPGYMGYGFVGESTVRDVKGPTELYTLYRQAVRSGYMAQSSQETQTQSLRSFLRTSISTHTQMRSRSPDLPHRLSQSSRTTCYSGTQGRCHSHITLYWSISPLRPLITPSSSITLCTPHKRQLLRPDHFRFRVRYKGRRRCRMRCR